MQPAYQRRKCRTRPFFQRLSIMASCFRKLGGDRTEPDNGRQKTHTNKDLYFIWPTKLCSKKKLLNTWKPSNREIFQLVSRWSLHSMKKRYRCFSILSHTAWYRRGRVCVYETAVNKKPTSCWRQECGRKRSLHLERRRSQSLVSLCKVAPPSLFLLPSPTRYAHVLVKRTVYDLRKPFLDTLCPLM